MGDVYWGLHAPLASQLVRGLGLPMAIETGSYYGGGALQLAAMCEKVWSIEHDPILYEFTRFIYSQVKNIEFILGDSPTILSKILPSVSVPCLFVLDAHWFNSSPRREFAKDRPCPVLGELEAIKLHCTTLERSAIIIDDADMFLGALPPPFRGSEYPSIVRVIECLEGTLTNCHVQVLDDVIVGGPKDTIDLINEYQLWKEKAGAPWR
jgi:hypothetical protein